VGVAAIISGALFAMRFEKILQILKFIWEFNVIVAAAFWVGIKWRRANRIGAWASMAIAFVCFFFLPILVPVFCPSLRMRPELLTKTRSIEMVRYYEARQMDIDERQKEIALWDQLIAAGKAEGAKPETLTVGEMFEKKYLIAGQGIFWTQGIRTDRNGTRMGKGDLNIELLLLNKLGYDLTNNPYALNETLRIIIRTLIPLLTIIVVSLLRKPDDKRMLDRFFAKMLTKVVPERVADTKELDRSMADTTRFNHKKIFPRSEWEFEKWDKDDWVGFTVSIAIVLGIILLLKILVSIG
jgi:SSS family solute:Na+ symporter